MTLAIMLKNLFKKKRIYLDYATATPLHPRVEKIMHLYATEKFFNAGTLHQGGKGVADDIRTARKELSTLVGGIPQEIIFTSGSTEANNLAVLGVVREAKKKIKRPHIITTMIEHASIKEVCRYLKEEEDVAVTYLSVNSEGKINLEELEKAFKKTTVLVSVMFANNEIGSIQPIREVAKLVRQQRKKNNSEYPYFHTDATQVINYFDLNMNKSGVDLMTLSGAKIYGPKGAGALVVKNTPITPLMFGGKQEWGFRPGTLNVPGIMGFVEAMKIAVTMRDAEVARLRVLQQYFFNEIRLRFRNVIINGNGGDRVPNNVSISFSNLSSEELLLELDARGVACSSQSACKTHTEEGSYVLYAIRKSSLTDATLRFSLGRDTTKKDIDRAVEILEVSVKKLEATKKLLS